MIIHKFKHSLLISSLLLCSSSLLWAGGEGSSDDESEDTSSPKHSPPTQKRSSPTKGIPLNLSALREEKQQEQKQEESKAPQNVTEQEKKESTPQSQNTGNSKKAAQGNLSHRALKTAGSESLPALASPRRQYEGEAGTAPNPENKKEDTRPSGHLSSRNFWGVHTGNTPRSGKKSFHIPEEPLAPSLDPTLMTPRDAVRVPSTPPIKQLRKTEIRNENYQKGEERLTQILASLNANGFTSCHPAATKHELEACLDLFEWAQKDGAPLADFRVTQVHFYLGIFSLPQGPDWTRTLRDISTLGGNFDPSSLQESLRYFRLASRRNYSEAVEWYVTLNYLVGELWFFQHHNKIAAEPYYREASRFHLPEALYALAGFEEKNEKKIPLLRKAAKKKHVPAMISLSALLLDEGIFPYEAAKWRKRAKQLSDESPMEEGHEAQLEVAEEHYQTGLSHMNDQDHESAARFLEAASKAGHKKASYALINCYQSLGKQVNVRAIYKRLADQGDAQAQYIYATVIEKTNPHEAQAYYKASEEAGYLLASFALAEAEYKTQIEKRVEDRSFRNAKEIFFTLTSKIREQALQAHEIMVRLCAELGLETEAEMWRSGIEALQKGTWVESLSQKDEKISEELQKALAEIHQKESDIHKPPACFLKKAKQFAKQKKVDQASYYFRLYLEALRTFAADAFYNLANIEVNQGHTSAAFRNHNAAATLGKGESQFWLGAFYEEHEEYEESAAWYENAANAGIAEAAIARAFLARDKGDKDTAKVWFTRVLERLAPNSVQALLNLGLMVLDATPREAEELFSRAAALKDTKALSLLGDIFIDRADKANQVAERMKRLRDPSSSTFSLQAEEAYQRGKSYYKEAAELRRGSAAFKLGKLAKKKGKTEKSLAWYKRSSDLGYARGQYKIAKYMVALGHSQEAIDLFSQASKTYLPALRGLGLLLLRTKGFDVEKTQGYQLLKSYIKQSRSEPAVETKSQKRKEAKVFFAIGNYLASVSTQYASLNAGIRNLKEAANLGMKKAYPKLLGYAQMMTESGQDGKKSVYALQLKDKFNPTIVAIYQFIIEGESHAPLETLKTAYFECGTLQCNMGLFTEGLSNLEQAEKLGHPQAAVLIKEKNHIKQRAEEEAKRQEEERRKETEQETKEKLKALITTPRERPSGDRGGEKLEQEE